MSGGGSCKHLVQRGGVKLLNKIKQLDFGIVSPPGVILNKKYKNKRQSTFKKGRKTKNKTKKNFFFFE